MADSAKKKARRAARLKKRGPSGDGEVLPNRLTTDYSASFAPGQVAFTQYEDPALSKILAARGWSREADGAMWLWGESEPDLLEGEYGGPTAVHVHEVGYSVDGPGPDDFDPGVPRQAPLRHASFATLEDLIEALPDLESWRFERGATPPSAG